MNTTKFAFVAAAVAALGLGTASEGLAQACIGTPVGNGQRALSAGVAFPEGATNYQARLDVNALGPLSMHTSYTRTEVANIGGSMNRVGAGVAYQLPSPVVSGNVPIIGCPTVGAAYSFSSGSNVDQNRLDVPVAFGLGTRVNVGAGMALVPYVQPQFVFSRTATTTGNQTLTATDTGVGATVGSALDFGPFFAGLDYSTTRWNDFGNDSQLGLRLGVKF